MALGTPVDPDEKTNPHSSYKFPWLEASFQRCRDSGFVFFVPTVDKTIGERRSFTRLVTASTIDLVPSSHTKCSASLSVSSCARSPSVNFGLTTINEHRANIAP